MKDNNLLKSLLVISIAFLIGIAFYKSIAANSLSFIALLMIIVFAIIGFIHWKKTLLFIPFLILFEGYIRRKFFDTTLILFIKDAGLLTVYLRCFFEYLKGNRYFFFKTNANLLILLFLIWYLLGLFNPNLPSFFQGILGIKVMFFYVPYFFLTKFIFEDKKSLFNYLYKYLILSVPICILAYIQYSKGVSNMHEQDVAFHTGTGDLILRPASTFYFNAAFSQYSYIIFTFLIAAINIKYFNRKRISLILILAANIISILLSGQRVVWVTLFMQINAFVVLGYDLSSRVKVVFKTLMTLTAVAALVLYVFGEIRGAVITRVKTITNVENIQEIEHVNQGYSFDKILRNSPIFGNGPGTATPASRYLPGADVTSLVEGGHVQIAWETGLIGLLMFLIILIKLTSHSISVSKRIKDRDLKMICVYGALLSVGFVFINLTTGIMTVSSSSILFWFSMGLVNTVEKLDGT
jgi:hypothetical protein